MKQSSTSTSARSKPLARPYVVVANAGSEEEFVVSEHASYTQAIEFKRRDLGVLEEFDTDVMKRRADGSLTTEF
jgi:hypothetical protein